MGFKNCCQSSCGDSSIYFHISSSTAYNNQSCMKLIAVYVVACIIMFNAYQMMLSMLRLQ